MRGLTQKRLKEIFYYNDITGVFTRIKKTSNKNNVGDIGGHETENNYLVIRIDGSKFLCHRLAFLYMTGDVPKSVDHINHNKKDNIFSNLRPANHEINGKNMSMRSSNKSGFTGVSWDRRECKWTARISGNKKQINLGRFDCKIDAIAARIRANRMYGYHKNHGASL